ncbi:MAG: response regulator [Anaerolineae bacterium]
MSKPQIMVVEDEGIVALSLQTHLKSFGYEVPVVVASGEEAIRYVRIIQPDLILMDIRLDGSMDGIEAAANIRSYVDIPIIYLTANSDEETLQRAKITEPYGYLLKPFEERELHTTIETALYKHQMERKLRESQQWLATTLHSIGEGIIATDATGCIKMMNPVAETLTGWSQAEALGQDLFRVFNIVYQRTETPTDDFFMSISQDVPATTQSQTFLIARDGKRRPVDRNIAPIRAREGNIIGTVVIFQDITSRQQAEDLQKELIKDLDAFAHTVSHNLRTPLTSIIGYVSLLEEHLRGGSEEVQNYVTTSLRSAKKMNSIIEALLLLASVRKEQIDLKPLNMARIVAEVQHRLASLIKEHEAELISPNSWPVALGYAPWVEEVWANYISNAIKYGGKSPRIHLGATARSDGMIRFWVRDNGPGLTQEEQSRLFTEFIRLNQIKVHGYGLGLSIVRRIISRLGGTVSVESEVGHGSTFAFTLMGFENQKTGDE